MNPDDFYFQRFQEAEAEWRKAIDTLVSEWRKVVENYRSIAVKGLDSRDEWIKECDKLRGLVRELAADCEEHNREYHHCTTAELLKRAHEAAP